MAALIHKMLAEDRRKKEAGAEGLAATHRAARAAATGSARDSVGAPQPNVDVRLGGPPPEEAAAGGEAKKKRALYGRGGSPTGVNI